MHAAAAFRALCAALLLAALAAVASPSAMAQDDEQQEPPRRAFFPGRSRAEKGGGPTAGSRSGARANRSRATSAPATEHTGQEPFSGQVVPFATSPDGNPGAAKPNAENAQSPTTTSSESQQPEAGKQPGAAAATGEGGVAIDAATFKGVQPGHSTRAELNTHWGEPRDVRNVDGASLQTYKIQAFDRVRATIVDDLVMAIVIYLDKPLPPEPLAKELELADIDPVEVTNDRGHPIGRAFPERGVMFGYAPGAAPPAVSQILLEPVDAQPFVARAEWRLESSYTRSLADLDRAAHLESGNAQVQFARSRVLASMGRLDRALAAAEIAARAEEPESRHVIHYASIMLRTADVDDARKTLQHALDNLQMAPLDRSRALSLLGHCLTQSPRADYGGSTQLQLEAIKLAEPLVQEERTAIRLGAKELLVDAHLELAYNVGWGSWQQKEVALPKWVERAKAVADDMVANEQASDEILFRVYERALAALAGMEQPVDPAAWIDQVLRLGKKLIDQGDDPARKQAFSWRTGVALAQAVQLENTLGRADSALAYGDLARDFLTQSANAAEQIPGHDYVLGRLYYTIGNIHAIRRGDHKQALVWYEKATPLLEKPVPAAVADSGRLGESLVGMAVSYWEVGNRKEAMRLTTEGTRLMEHSVEEGTLAKTALAVPYGNLANMHKELGQEREATRFSQMAATCEAADRK